MPNRAQTDRYYPFLLEIRKRLLFVITLFLVATVAGFLFYERLVRWVLHFLNLPGINVVFTSPFQFFTLAVNSGMVVAPSATMRLRYLDERPSVVLPLAPAHRTGITDTTSTRESLTLAISGPTMSRNSTSKAAVSPGFSALAKTRPTAVDRS